MLLHFFRRILRVVIKIEVRAEINPLRIIPVYAENIYFKHHAVNSIYEQEKESESNCNLYPLFRQALHPCPHILLLFRFSRRASRIYASDRPL